MTYELDEWKMTTLEGLVGFCDPNEEVKFVALQCAKHGADPKLFFDVHTQLAYASVCRGRVTGKMPTDEIQDYVTDKLRVVSMCQN
jgi:hypothetical protein